MVYQPISQKMHVTDSEEQLHLRWINSRLCSPFCNVSFRLGSLKKVISIQMQAKIRHLLSQLFIWFYYDLIVMATSTCVRMWHTVPA